MTIEEAKKEIEIYAHRESGLSSIQVVELDHVFDTLEELQNDLLQNVSYSVAQQYAEFCVRCDREKLPLIKIEDYLKQL